MKVLIESAWGQVNNGIVSILEWTNNLYFFDWKSLKTRELDLS